MIVFDLDGTLTDISERWYQLHLDCAAEYALTYVSRSRYINLKREGVGEMDIMKETNPNAPADTLAAYDSKRIAFIEDPSYLAYDRLQPGIVELLHEIRARAIPCVLISKRKSPEAARQQLEEWGVAGYFEQTILTTSKKEALEKTFTSELLQASVFVSDAAEDVAAADALGMPWIAVSYGCRSEAYFRKLGVTTESTVEALRTRLTDYV